MKKVIVVKIGRSIATSKRNKIDTYRFEQLAKQIKLLQQDNISVMLVVSAAVSCGEKAIELNRENNILKQLLGGIGQATVIAELYSIFTKQALKIGQLLVTKNDLEDQQKRKTIAAVLQQAAEKNIVLIINENDIIDLHSFGGNDYLATEIAELMHAEKLLLLTDVDGVFDEHMQIIKTYTTDKVLAPLIKTYQRGEVGGMKAKLDAAIKAANQGTTTWIAYGKTRNLLTRMVVKNEHIGTKVLGGSL